MAGKKTGSKKQTNVVKRKENKNKQTWLKKTTTKTNKRGRKKQNKNKQMWSEKKRGRKKKPGRYRLQLQSFVRPRTKTSPPEIISFAMVIMIMMTK